MVQTSLIVIVVGILSATLRVATPLIFAALGGMYSERSGIINIALEGIILIGALVAVVVTYFSNMPWLGIVVAAMVGGLASLIHAWVSIDAHADQIISGTALNILAVGATSYLLIAIWGQAGHSPIVEKISPLRVPLLSSIPVLGELFREQNLLTYLALLLIPVSHFFLFKTALGLRLRSVGEHPLAAETVGINVQRFRYFAVFLSGVLSGLAGAYLSISQTSSFVKMMSDGRGFIALAAMIFGRWRPFGLFFACLLFGFSDSVQWVLQALGVNISSQFLLALPYVLTLIIISIIGNKADPPAAVGKVYHL